MSKSDEAHRIATEVERAVAEDPCWFCDRGDDHHVSRHIGPTEAGMIAYSAALMALTADPTGVPR